MTNRKYIVSLLLVLATSVGINAQQPTREQLLKLFYQARQAQRAGETDEAVALYKQIIRLSPRLPDTYIALGDIYKADTSNIHSQEMATTLYGFYIQLKPDASDLENVRIRQKEASHQLEKLKQRAQITQLESPTEIASEISTPTIESKIAQVESEHVAQPKPVEIKPSINTDTQTKAEATFAIPGNLTGRYASTTKAENGREAWILDIKDVNGELWISINAKSAVKETELFEAMTSMDIPGRIENGKLKFDFTIHNVYEEGKGVMGSIGDFLGNMLGVDVFEWNLFAKNKETRNLAYNYAFELSLESYSLKGFIQTSVRDEAAPETLLSNNTQACELFRSTMNYGGLSIYILTEEVKRTNDAFQNLFEETKKRADKEIPHKQSKNETASTDTSNYTATNDLGCLYWSGVGTKQNMKKAIECFTSAALKNTQAQLNLATLYLNGNGVEKDVEKARNWYLMAAEKGCTDAYVLCGDSYLFSETGDSDYDTALYYYNKAIELNNAFGLFRLGWLYKEGMGVKADRSTALTYLEKAMAAGSTDAIATMAALYEESGNYSKALTLLEEGANKQNATAMFQLSDMYLRGLGVKQNFLQAKVWEGKAMTTEMHILSGYNSLETKAKEIYNQLAK